MRSRKKGKKRKRERLGTNARALLHKPANIFFFISLSYVKQGKRVDLTCSPFGWTKKTRENNMFHCDKITLEVFSQLFNEDHASLLYDKWKE